MLGPSYGGEGPATRASFIPCETKNTELGWGVVHFYRESDETTALGGARQEDEQESADFLEDCTTLCIPAVPVYMSPSDLLGFVGERWLEDISHCRMVMTSRMNRYLVLLKFRDGRCAKKWKREFDGKVFNSMEVGHHLS
jgi:BRCA1-associated protein